MASKRKDLEKQYKEVFKTSPSLDKNNKGGKTHFERFSIYKPTNLTYTAGTTQR